ncbi:MAG: hypothetical protein ACRDL0_03310 [Thermoleophilaceae bacterium]
MGGVEATEIRDLLSQFPRIPSELDLALLVEGEKTLGSLRERQDLKHEIRGAFWATVKEGSSPAANLDA